MNILIVDDAAGDRSLLHKMLKAEGRAIFEASDGVEALDMLKRTKMDAVISDILMPRMDGYHLCFRMRQKAEFNTIPVLIYTDSFTSPSDERMALDLGADRFLKKPLPGDEIVKAVRQAIIHSATARRHVRHPTAALDGLTEYSERLVNLLEKTNAELAASDSKFRPLVEQSIVGIYLIQDERFAYVNPKMVEIMGIQAEELTVGPLYAFIAPEDRALVRDNIRAAHGGRHLGCAL